MRTNRAQRDLADKLLIEPFHVLGIEKSTIGRWVMPIRKIDEAVSLGRMAEAVVTGSTPVVDKFQFDTLFTVEILGTSAQRTQAIYKCLKTER